MLNRISCDYTARRYSRCPFFLALTLVCAGIMTGPQIAVAKSTSATAGSGFWFKATDSGSTSQWYSTNAFASTATITWSLPTATLNGAAQTTAPLPLTENKFLCLAIPCAGKVFAGYAYARTAGGSSITSSGSGDSDGPPYNGFRFSVQAGGTGTYEIKAVAKDPLGIFPSDLAGLGPTYSAFIPFSMTSGQLQSGVASSSYGFDVNYTTSSGTTSLLNIAVGTDGVTVTPSSAFNSSQLKFFQESTLALNLGGSAATPGTQLTDINSFIRNDIASDGSLIAPLYLGIVLSGISTPMTLLSDGSVAQISISANASEVAVIPEPSTWSLFAVGLIVVLGYGWRQRAAAYLAYGFHA